MTLQRELEEYAKTPEFMEESLKLVFAELLAIEMRERKLNIENFASLINLTTPRTLHYIFNTRVNLTLKDIAKYCAPLGIRPNFSFIKIDTGEKVNLG